MKLYDYAPSANCYKVRLLLANLGREYERVPVDIFAGQTLTDEFAAMNPARTTPVLEIDDGRFLPESAAILSYLAEGTPLMPGDAFGRAAVLRWLLYEQTEVIPPIAGLRFRLHTQRIDPDGRSAQRLSAAGHEVLSALDKLLDESPYLVGGAYSIADTALFGYVHVAGEAGYEMDRYPAVVAWLERVKAQPGYMNDLQPYPPNSMAGASRSIYD
jgi:glutathione S-transferase